MLKKFLFLIIFSFIVALGALSIGLSARQSLVLAVFSLSILGTLFFWSFRLSFVFIGSGIFLLIRAVNLDDFIRYASLDVILFLISMMIIVGMMKEAGFFYWLITLLLRVKDFDGRKFLFIVMGVSAVFTALMDEVTAIIIMVTVILNICTFLEIRPVPMIISSVMAANIGSAATVLGNPVGVLIAARSGLSFEDFLTHALPLSTLVLLVAMWLLSFYYRDYIRELSGKLSLYQDDKSFLYLISIPPDRKTKISIVIFGVTLLMIALHRRVEILLSLEENTMLIMTPVIAAGVVMLYRRDKARHYVEQEVEWNSLLFFMFLFAQAGVIQATGIANVLAHKMTQVIGHNSDLLLGFVLFSSGFISSGLDNVVAVAAYVPVVQSLEMLHYNLKPLWWVLLFGACFGGNITMIGSTANIVALDLLEKEQKIKVSFGEWFKIGLVVGVLSMLIAFLAVLTIPIYLR